MAAREELGWDEAAEAEAELEELRLVPGNPGHHYGFEDDSAGTPDHNRRIGPPSDSKAVSRLGGYDAHRRRRVVTRGREAGGWVYIPAAELEAAGRSSKGGGVLRYRVWGRRGGSVLVRIYKGEA